MIQDRLLGLSERLYDISRWCKVPPDDADLVNEASRLITDLQTKVSELQSENEVLEDTVDWLQDKIEK